MVSIARAFGRIKAEPLKRLHGELIEQVWNSLPEKVDPSEVPAWHLAELAKRRAEADERPGEGRPWREVLGQIETES